ncbi:MAG: CRISPR-associated endonuclease Cas1 [Elusimicrobiota bacterium]|jgi:CRISPR-associated protein Cas1|nr:CRISPR-associated endonuclease Cas1 [Elusimicrobiota bacterium]
MELEYIKEPQKFIQQNLFADDEVFVPFDPPLFFDSLIRWQFNEDIWFLSSKDLSYLLVSGYGVSLSKHSERLIIKDGKKTVYEVPFFRLKNLAIMSKGVGLSSDLIEKLNKSNINLSFHDFSGKPYALVQSIFTNQSSEIKRKQLLSQNSKIALSLIKRIVCGKIANQISLLKYVVKNVQSDNQEGANKIQVVQKACLNMKKYASTAASLAEFEEYTQIRNAVMGYEGTAARIYWDVIGFLLSAKVNFQGRNDKIPHDAVNTLLNYGYGILYCQIWESIVLAGLDPYVGFLHTSQSGKPSLVFDLIEEFRAPIIDRTVFAFIMLNRKIEITNNMLGFDTRQSFSQKVLDRLSSCEYYEGQKVLLSDIILAQAKRFANCLQNETVKYNPFVFKW